MKKLVLAGCFGLLLVSGNAKTNFTNGPALPVHSVAGNPPAGLIYDPLNNPWNLFWWIHNWHYQRDSN